MTVNPSILNRVGRNRCMPLNNLMRFRHSFLYALREQPVSLISSHESLFLIKFATVEEIRFIQGSFLLCRHPHTISYVFNFSSNAGMSAGSFCRSASIETTYSPAADLKPAS